MSGAEDGLPADGPRVVALGGGHGLAASLQALRRVTPHLTAVVTVADDGGSSGRLREELGILPPGDLRMALAALAGEAADHRTWQTLLQHRFDGDGPLAGHAVGNLVLANVGNLTYAVYVFSLPVGPIWALHSFYMVSSAAMLAMWVGYRRRLVQASRSRRTVGGATVRNASRQIAASSSSPTAGSSTPSQPRWPTYGGRKNRSGSVSVISA